MSSDLVPEDFPFPLAEPRPAPVFIERPCPPCGPLHGCTFMQIGDEAPMQVSWCVVHDPGYPPPNTPAPLPNRPTED